MSAVRDLSRYRDDFDDEIDGVDSASDFEPLTKLSTSERLVFDLVKAAMDDRFIEVVLSSRNVLVVMRVRSSWHQSVARATSEAIGTVLRGVGDVQRPAVSVVSEKKPLSSIADLLKARHVVTVVSPEIEVPPAQARLSDLVVDIRPSIDDLLSVIRRQFPDAAGWPDGLHPDDVSPSALDIACERARSATDVFDLIRAVEEALVDEESARLEEERQAGKNDKARRSSKVVAATEIAHPSSPLLEDLHGYGAAAVWAGDLVRDLADYAAGALDWADVDGGCLLYGPPGTGKTMFASALAASAGLPFIATSYMDWQSQGEAHGGTLIKALKARFDGANAVAPCVLFIDEIDAIPARGTSGRYDDWWRPVVTALLECLDGSNRRQGVVVIAACNDPSGLDPALVRSGRLDRRFEIGLPDENALERIFAHHLPGGDPAAFETAAAALAGACSGADVSRIAREARRSARRESRPVTAADLLHVAIPPDERDPLVARMIAVHESGHAVAALAAGAVVEVLSLSQKGPSGGRVGIDYGMNLGQLAEVEASIVVALAGRAAEEVIIGEPSAGARGDLEEATNLVRGALVRGGLVGRLSHASHPASDDALVEDLIQTLSARAIDLITEHREAVEALAELALRKRVLGRRAIAEFAAAHDLKRESGQ